MNATSCDFIQPKLNTRPGYPSMLPEPVFFSGHHGLKIKDADATFDAYRCRDLFSCHQDILATKIGSKARAFILCDPTVYNLYGSQMRRCLDHHQIESYYFPLPAAEPYETVKTSRTVDDLVKDLWPYHLGGEDKIVICGGGATLDVCKYVANFFRRKITGYIAIPTTLVAVVDAAISSKFAINVDRFKNALGDVWHPQAVLYDPKLLESVSTQSFQDGLAEIVKLAIIGDQNLFMCLEDMPLPGLRESLCSEHADAMLQRCIYLFSALKWTGPCWGNEPASIRAFGHKFSRVLEGTSDYRITHGRAVAVEMVVAVNLAANCGVLQQNDRDSIQACLRRLQLPSYCDECQPDTLWHEAFERSFTLNRNFYFPAPSSVGVGTFLDRFSLEDLSRAIEEAKGFETIIQLAE